MFRDSMMTNNMMGGNMFGQQPRMQYMQMQKPTMSQPLTPEERKLISNKGGAFNTNVSKEDLLRTICTHKDGNDFALITNGDGTFTCPLCQETFRDTDLDQEHVKQCTSDIIDILQLIKTYYVDIPEETARQFFPMIALIKKIPALASMAVNNFARYEDGNMAQSGGTPYGFNMLNALTGTPYSTLGMPNPYQPPMQQPMYQQPMYQPQMQQPMYQQPMGASYMPQPTAPAQVNVTPTDMGNTGFQPFNEFGGYYNQQPMPQVNQANMQQPAGQQSLNEQASAQPNAKVDTSSFTV